MTSKSNKTKKDPDIALYCSGVAKVYTGKTYNIVYENIILVGTLRKLQTFINISLFGEREKCHLTGVRM